MEETFQSRVYVPVCVRQSQILTLSWYINSTSLHSKKRILVSMTNIMVILFRGLQLGEKGEGKKETIIIHLFNKYISIIYSVPGSGDTAVT